MEKKTITLIRQSLVSGVLVGTGDVINLLSGNKYIGAMLFSFALLTIIHNKLPLYTGRIGFVRNQKVSDLLQMLVFNLVGALVPVFMTVYGKREIYASILTSSRNKFSYNFLALFFLGVLCGILMLVAVYTKQQVITVFCIMIFILSGFEHCIADFPFLVVNFSAVNTVKFLCIVLGNSAGAVAAYELMADKGTRVD